MTSKLVIVLNEGDVQEVISDGQPVEVAVVDYDVDEDAPEDLMTVPNAEGEAEEAYAVMVPIEVDRQRVEAIHRAVQADIAPRSQSNERA